MSASPPKFIRPCIPTTAKAIPHGAAWLHEPKLDGYRFQIVKDGDRVRLCSRSGYEWTKRLASLATALADIRCESAVIDGELVFPNASGNPEFRGLQAVMGSHRQHELAVFAFDLLHHDGTDLRPIPLIKRRRQLTELVARSDVYCLHLAQVFDNGAKLLNVACLLIFGVAQTAAQHHEQRSVHVESGPRRSVWHFVEQSAAIVGITSFLSQVAMWIYFWPS